MNRYITILFLSLATASILYAQTKPLPEHFYLQPGDKVAVISPAAMPMQAQIDSTMLGLKEWGYEPVLGKHVLEDVRTVDDCLEDVLWALRDPEIQAIFCVRGGAGSAEVMDLLPTDTLRKYPKLLIGYSDISAMHSAWTKAGIPSIHASMSAAFMGLPDTCVQYQKKMMQGEMPTYTFEGSEYNTEGEAEGILIGGNLAIYQMALFSHFCSLPTDEPYIILLEDVTGTWTYMLYSLTLFKHLGVFKNAQAVLFGEWVDMEPAPADYSGRSRGGEFTSAENLIYRQIDNKEVPTAYYLPIGHGEYNYPLRMGQKVRVKITKRQTVLEFL